MTARRDDGRGPGTSGGEQTKVRVDVWLWSVRQCKTRSLATSECKAGHVRVNGETADAGYRIAFARTAGEETVYYIAADFVKQYTNFSYEVFEEPCHMQIYTEWGERQAADITKNTAVRILGGVKSPILRQITA